MTPPPKKFKRRIKLIKPRLQFRLIGSFVGLACLAFLLQTLLIAMRLTELSSEIPNGGGAYVQSVLPTLLLEVLLFSFGVLMPLIIGVGVLVTFRIAGPVYRAEQYLIRIARGEEVGPFRLRKGDELQEFAERLDEASAHLQRSTPRGDPQSRRAA